MAYTEPDPPMEPIRWEVKRMRELAEDLKEVRERANWMAERIWSASERGEKGDWIDAHAQLNSCLEDAVTAPRPFSEPLTAVLRTSFDLCAEAAKGSAKRREGPK